MATENLKAMQAPEATLIGSGLFISHLNPNQNKDKNNSKWKPGLSSPELIAPHSLKKPEAIQSISAPSGPQVDRKLPKIDKRPAITKKCPLPQIKPPRFVRKPYNSLVPFDLHMSKTILTRVCDPMEFQKEKPEEEKEEASGNETKRQGTRLKEHINGKRQRVKSSIRHPDQANQETNREKLPFMGNHLKIDEVVVELGRNEVLRSMLPKSTTNQSQIPKEIQNYLVLLK